MEQLLTTEELTNVLKVHRATLYEWRKLGLPFIQVNGGRIRYKWTDVEKWLAERQGQEA